MSTDSAAQSAPAEEQAVELVIDTLARLLDADEQDMGEQTPLEQIEGWDSVNALRVLLYLEKKLSTALDYEGFTSAQTVGDLAGVVGASAETSDGGR